MMLIEASSQAPPPICSHQVLDSETPQSPLNPTEDKPNTFLEQWSIKTPKERASQKQPVALQSHWQ
jgi:hypothetical protein